MANVRTGGILNKKKEVKKPKMENTKNLKEMAFDVPCVREYLEKHGEVYTVRSYLYNELENRWTAGIGEVELEMCQVITPQNIDEVLRNEFDSSGFKTAAGWKEQILKYPKNANARELYLFWVGKVQEEKIDRSFYSTKDAIDGLRDIREKILQYWSYRGKLFIKIDHWDRIYFDGFDELKYTPAGRLILVSKETSDKATVKQETALEARDHYDKQGNRIKGTRTLAKEYAANLKDKLSVLEGDFVDYLDEWNDDKREIREDETDEFDNTPINFDATRPLYELAGNSYREDFSQPDKRGVT